MKEKIELPLEALAADFKKTAAAVARAAVGRLNVVSREEFEAQNVILAQAIADMRRIEEKLDAAVGARSGGSGPGKSKAGKNSGAGRKAEKK